MLCVLNTYILPPFKKIKSPQMDKSEAESLVYKTHNCQAARDAHMDSSAHFPSTPRPYLPQVEEERTVLLLQGSTMAGVTHPRS